VINQFPVAMSEKSPFWPRAGATDCYLFAPVSLFLEIIGLSRIGSNGNDCQYYKLVKQNNVSRGTFLTPTHCFTWNKYIGPRASRSVLLAKVSYRFSTIFGYYASIIVDFCYKNIDFQRKRGEKNELFEVYEI